MTAAWGHFVDDGCRHLLQVNRERTRARHACHGTRTRPTSDVPDGSAESDLPACKRCLKRRPLLRAPMPPAVRSGWVAGRSPARTLDDWTQS